MERTSPTHESAVPSDERAPRRLRDLHGRDRALALALFGLGLVPFVVSLVRAYHDGWIPSGDEANIATRALDVLSHHPPLTGLPSTSAAYGRHIYTQHPGPIEFYLLALPLRVLGRTSGPLLTAAAINAAFVFVALWVVFRRAGLWAMLGAGVVLQAVMWSGGTAVLSETLSSNMTLYSLLATAVLAWALADGDVRLLPLAVIVATYAAQQHLAAGLVALPLVIAGLASLVITRIVDARRAGPLATHRDHLGNGRLVLLSAALAALAWTPVVIDQLTGHPGNLTAIVDFARDHSRPTLGLGSGFTQLVHTIAPPSLLAMTDVSGATLTRHAGSARDVAAAIVVVALLAVVIGAFRTRRALARMAGITLVLLAAGVVNGSNVPTGIESARAAEYRWTWVAAFMTVTTLGWAAALVVLRSRRVHGLRVGIALLAATAVIAGATIAVRGSDDVPRDAEAFALERRVDAAVLAHVEHGHPIAVVYHGGQAAIDVGYQVVFRLVEAGYRVELSPASTRALGSPRRYRPDSAPSAIVITSGDGPLPPEPGTVVHQEVFDREFEALVARLAAATAHAPIELAPDAPARADRLVPGSFPFVRAELARYRTDPAGLLRQPALVSLILAGVYRAPTLTAGQLRRLRDLATDRPMILGDERIRVSVLTPSQVRATPPRELTSFSAP